MLERTLTERDLNRAMLARQLLLRRGRLPLARAIERVGGLQTQYSPSGYLGLWTRLTGFERHHLTQALERRTVVQGTLMRSTIHMVSARDYPLLAAGVRRDRRAWWLGVTGGRFDHRQMEATARRLRRLLAAGPRRRAELVAELDIEATVWNGLGAWIDLLRVPPSGTWERRRADLYAAAEDWIGAYDVSLGRGLEHVVRRYLGGFGPASRKDIAGWAGVSVATLAPVLERMALRRFRDEQGAELLDLPRAPLPGGDVPAPARLLPTWEPMLLVHHRRTAVLPEEYRPVLFSTKTPHSSPTFLIDGRVAGRWTHEGGRVRLEPFAPLPRAARRELADEVQLLEAWLA